MKKYSLLLLMLLMGFGAYAQNDVKGSRVIALDEFFLKDTWVTKLKKNTDTGTRDDASLPTTLWVEKYISALTRRTGVGSPLIYDSIADQLNADTSTAVGLATLHLLKKKVDSIRARGDTLREFKNGDSTTICILVAGSGGGGSGTVTSFAFTNTSGITGTVSNPTTTPSLALSIDTAAISNFFVKVRAAQLVNTLSSASVATQIRDSLITIHDSLININTRTVANTATIGTKVDSATVWKHTGNANIDASKFIGTTNNSTLRFRTNNVERMKLDSATGVLTLASNSIVMPYATINGITSGGGPVVLNIGNNGLGQPTLYGANSQFNLPDNIKIGGVNNNVTSAKLEIESTTRGVLIPRMTNSQMLAIGTPADGLQVYNTDIKAVYVYNSDWGWESESSLYSIKNELKYRNDLVTTTVSDGFLTSSVGSGGSVGAITGIASRPGIQAPSTGSSSANGRCTFATDASAILPGSGRILFEEVVRIPTLSSSTETFYHFFGLSAQTTASAQVNGILFMYDSSGAVTGSTASGRWQVMTASASNRTFTLSNVQVVENQWYRLTAIVNAAGTSVEFYIDGTIVGTPHTTNIPSVALGLVSNLQKTVGTTARTTNLDYIYLKHKFTTSR